MILKLAIFHLHFFFFYLVLWTAQGVVLAENSSSKNAGLHSGIFATFQNLKYANDRCKKKVSLYVKCFIQIIGGFFLYFMSGTLNDGATMSDATISLLYGAFLISSLIGWLLISLLRAPTADGFNDNDDDHPPRAQQMAVVDAAMAATTPNQIETQSDERRSSESIQTNIKAATQVEILFIAASALHTLTRPPMLLLLAAFAFAGLSLALYESILPSSIGFTQRLGQNAKQIIGLSAIVQGCGIALGRKKIRPLNFCISALLGSFFATHYNGRRSWQRRELLIAAAATLNLLAFAALWANLPGDAPLHATNAGGALFEQPK